MQSALSVYHHLWREESALKLGHNPTRTAHTGGKSPPSRGRGLWQRTPSFPPRQLRGQLEFRNSFPSDDQERGCGG